MTAEKPASITAHEDPHLVGRQGWLRAAMMGANDGILSTAALIIGVAAGGAGPGEIVLAGIAGAVAGATAMAAGEYISVSSQSDLVDADIAREKAELEINPEGELSELAAIYEERGLDPELAQEVARQLTQKDALGAHLRDEIGVVDLARASPVQAALASATAFTAGAVAPIAVAALSPQSVTGVAVAISTVCALALLGALGAQAGRASRGRAALRVTFWGILAMGITAGVGRLVGLAL